MKEIIYLINKSFASELYALYDYWLLSEENETNWREINILEIFEKVPKL
jgi:hypothetical protein